MFGTNLIMYGESEIHATSVSGSCESDWFGGSGGPSGACEFCRSGRDGRPGGSNG